MIRAIAATLLTGSVMAGAACAAPRAQPISIAGVYAGLFETTFHGTPAAAMLVAGSAEPMPTIGGSGALASWLAEFDELPQSLRQAVSQPTPTGARDFAVGDFPSGTRVVSPSAIREHVTGSLEDSWSAFTRRHNAYGWMSFSDVLFSDDGLDALVYYSAACGSLCGEAGYAWLHRDSAQSRWSLKKKIISRMA